MDAVTNESLAEENTLFIRVMPNASSQRTGETGPQHDIADASPVSLQWNGSGFSRLGIILHLAGCIAIKDSPTVGTFVIRGALLATKPAKIGNRNRAGSEQLLRRWNVSLSLRISYSQDLEAIGTNNIWQALLHYTAERKK